MRLLFCLIFAGLFVASPVDAKPKLPPIRNLKVQYDFATEKVLISWAGSPLAKKYEVLIQGAAGIQIAATKKLGTRSSTTSKAISSDNFTEGTIYTIAVRAAGFGDFDSSDERSTKYRFSRRVKTKEIYKELQTENSGGRRGTVYLPKNYRLRSLPIMLLLHGSGIDGNAVARILRKYAREREFIIVAPDSVHEWGWEITVDGGVPTEDQQHIEKCFDEVLNYPLLEVNPERVLVAGISAGAEISAFIGSNDAKFTSFAVLHGGVDIPSLGSNKIPAWLSTGSVDTLRTPEEVNGYKPELEALGFPNVVYEEFNAAHTIPEDERAALVEWWFSTFQ